jgi:hypothetical protein
MFVSTWAQPNQSLEQLIEDGRAFRSNAEYTRSIEVFKKGLNVSKKKEINKYQAEF